MNGFKVRIQFPIKSTAIAYPELSISLMNPESSFFKYLCLFESYAFIDFNTQRRTKRRILNTLALGFRNTLILPLHEFKKLSSVKPELEKIV